MNNERQRILAVIPAYNEAARLGPVAAAAGSFLPVLVVDDGSSDETALVGRQSGADVLTQTPNQGKGAALQAGFRKALEWGYDAVVTLDADGQHDPREIAAFVQMYERGPVDLIIGQRTFSQMPPVRRLANTLAQQVFSWAIGRPIPDNQSGFRMLGRRLIEALRDHTERGFEFEVAMIAICVREDFRLAWVPIRTIYNGEASHIQPVQHTLNFVRVALAARQMVTAPRPLQRRPQPTRSLDPRAGTQRLKPF